MSAVELELVAEIRSCSSPFEDESHDLAEELVVVHAQEYARVLLKRFEAILGSRTDGFVPWIKRALSETAGFDVAWDPSFGHVRRSVLFGAVDPVVAAVQLGLHLHAHGVEGQWSARLSEAVDLKWGQAVLSRCTAVRVDGAALSATGAAGETALLGAENRTLEGSGSAFERLPIGSWHLYITPRHKASTIMADYGVDWTREPRTSVAATCRCAIDILDSFARPYADWVGRALRYVVPVAASGGLLKSKSSDDWPSVAEISFPAQPIAVAEMLVHEATHQYMHMASRLGELWDAPDDRLFYSPVKGTDRPIYGILLAFHAFANVVLFYRCCLSGGLVNDYCVRNEKRHLAELEILIGHLQSDNGLTSIGHALWQPLAERVFSRIE